MTRRNKYGNTKTKVDGLAFASKAEARRYGELKLLERGGVIQDLELQPKFGLIGREGTKICTYKADFRYAEMIPGTNRISHIVVEDVKSPSTAKERSYRLKSKLFRDNFGYAITEVVA